MIWKKKGEVKFSDLEIKWAKSHLMCPTPVLVSSDVIRIYFTCLDEFGRGKVTFIEVSSVNPTRVLYVHPDPILGPGLPGAFDDNGVVVTSVIKTNSNNYFMYYAGFEICNKIRYRILTGLAISDDAGKCFRRFSTTPVLERTQGEEFFRCGAYVFLREGQFKMWYVGGGSWTKIGEKVLPNYDIKYAESKDGINWPSQGKTVLPVTEKDEHGFGRPWVSFSGLGNYEMFYSIRSISKEAYHLGYAISQNGKNWERRDAQVGLSTIPDSLSTSAIMYSSVITVNGRTFCFYNGDNFGEIGFLISEMIL